jgi:hypothetical protein
MAPCTGRPYVSARCPSTPFSGTIASRLDETLHDQDVWYIELGSCRPLPRFTQIRALDQFCVSFVKGNFTLRGQKFDKLPELRERSSFAALLYLRRPLSTARIRIPSCPWAGNRSGPLQDAQHVGSCDARCAGIGMTTLQIGQLFHAALIDGFVFQPADNPIRHDARWIVASQVLGQGDCVGTGRRAVIVLSGDKNGLASASRFTNVMNRTLMNSRVATLSGNRCTQ